MKLEFKVDAKRLEDLVTLDQLIDLEEGKTRAIRDVMGLFLIDPETGTYYPGEDGRKVMGKLTVGQIREIGSSFTEMVQSAAVPPTTPRD